MGCRRRAPQGELTRVVAGPEGSLVVGRTLPGRGVWLCTGSATCLEVAARQRRFERALRSPVRPGATDRLADELGWAPSHT